MIDNFLTKKDTYSLILFLLYVLKDDPKYVALSQLAYVLDFKNMLNLCEYFGGLTITVPTIEELETVTYALTLYQDVELCHKDFQTCLKKLALPKSLEEEVVSLYGRIIEILSNYNINKK